MHTYPELIGENLKIELLRRFSQTQTGRERNEKMSAHASHANLTP